jgi:hypothetical protein
MTDWSDNGALVNWLRLCFAKASHAARSSVIMILIFTYINLVVMVHYVRDTVSAKRQENGRRWVEVRFRQLSNETPLVEVKSQLVDVIVSVIWEFFFRNLGVLLLFHHLFF